MEPAAQAAISDHILKGSLEISPQRKGFQLKVHFCPHDLELGLKSVKGKQNTYITGEKQK